MNLNSAGIANNQILIESIAYFPFFCPPVHLPLEELRAIAKDGLFTAYNKEPNWGKAHRILMPAFGPIGVRGMFDQMFVCWERFVPDALIGVADNMTRLTLDIFALCAFGYRFNSF